MKTTSKTSRLSRREFLGAMTVGAASFQIVPGAVLGLNGATSPNERLNVAGIGVGGRGYHDITAFRNENIVALCDVDWRQASRSFKEFPKAKRYKDYRRLLEEMDKDIDAVVVATPDHTHAPASMLAMERGKHVYCEKPLTHSVWEARRVAETAHQRGLATQMGNQGQAEEDVRRLCELVWHDAIGPVREAHVWTDRPSRGLFDEYWPQGVGRPRDTPAVPRELAWNLWLGVAPERPYHPAYCPFKWRGWWDFGTGALGDIGCHALDPVFRALKLGAPTTVQAASTRVNKETYPLGSMVTYQFPARGAGIQDINVHIRGLSGADAGAVAMPPVKLVWYDGGLRPPRPVDLPDQVPMGDNGRLLVGDHGFILGTRVFQKDPGRQWSPPPKSIPRSDDHHQEWARACKGGKPAGSNFDWAGPLAEAVLLGNVALRVDLREALTIEPLKWDPAKMRFPNLEEANQFLRRDYRTGW